MSIFIGKTDSKSEYSNSESEYYNSESEYYNSNEYLKIYKYINQLHPFTKKWDTLIIYFFLKNYLLLRINN